jgi:hypothetical protein
MTELMMKPRPCVNSISVTFYLSVTGQGVKQWSQKCGVYLGGPDSITCKHEVQAFIQKYNNCPVAMCKDCAQRELYWLSLAKCETPY